MPRIALLLLLAIVLSPLTLQAQPRREKIVLPPAMKRYETAYYVVFTDLGDEAAREAGIRVSRMAEEYYERTREFSGRIHTRFPFYLFATLDDYHRAGGVPGSGGVFMGDRINGFRLMAFAHEPLDARTWQTVQHEGFHQFAHAVIGGDMPIWVNEGLAEYFGEGIFTGDGFVTGVIPPWRLERIKLQIEAGRFMPIPQMMMLSHEQWNAMLDRSNYDQAWAMVHFLAHAEDGKYQKAFARFMNAIGKRVPWEQAWLASFGSARGFEDKFKAYWNELPKHPTQPLYTKATALTLTSFLARAHQQGQTFDSFEAFIAAAEKQELKIAEAGWLPPSLLAEALKAHKQAGTWSLETPAGKPPQIVVKLPDETHIFARFVMKGDRVESVKADIDDLPRLMTQARALQSDGKLVEARQMLSGAVKDNPRSPFAADARKLAQEMK